MTLPPLPKQLNTGTLRSFLDLAERLSNWSRGVQKLLASLKGAVENEVLLLDGSTAMNGPLDLNGYGAIQTGVVEFSQAPFRFESNAAVLDVASAAMWPSAVTLTSNSTITLANGAAGSNGVIWVQQDATGGWTLAFEAPGWTIVRDLAAADSNPQSAANTITQYRYFFVQLAGVQTVVIYREKLT